MWRVLVAVMVLSASVGAEEPSADAVANKSLETLKGAGVDRATTKPVEDKLRAYERTPNDATLAAVTAEMTVITAQQQDLLERREFLTNSALRLRTAGLPEEKMHELLTMTSGNLLEGKEWVAATDLVVLYAKKRGATSDVVFQTTAPGAVVKYQTVGQHNRHETPTRVNDVTNNAKAKLLVGFYVVWAERNNVATSKEEQFRIIEKTELVRLPEYE